MTEYSWTTVSSKIVLTDESTKEIEASYGYSLEELLAAADQLFKRALYPEGRQAAYERIDRMCEISPSPEGGSIDRSPNRWWKTKTPAE